MQHRFHTFLLFGLTACLAVALPRSAHAQNLRVATIDMSRVLKSSSLARDAEADLGRQADTYEAELRAMGERLQKMGEAYRTAREAATNPALSASRQEELKDEAVRQLTELKEYELQLRERKEEVEADLRGQNRRVRERIVTTLREQVGDFARRNGYDLVVDSITVLYQGDAVTDLTDQVLALLQDE